MKTIALFLISFFIWQQPACLLLCDGVEASVASSPQHCRDSSTDEKNATKPPSSFFEDCCPAVWIASSVLQIDGGFASIIQVFKQNLFQDLTLPLFHLRLLHTIHSPPERTPSGEFYLHVFSAHAPPVAFF